LNGDESRAAVRAYRAEAKRLDGLIGASASRLRLLTVVCHEEHKLLDVYGIAGRFLWVGSTKYARVDKWPDGTLGKKRVRRGLGILDDPVTHFALMGPVGSCKCGSFKLKPEWVLGQARDPELPSHRRVVPPWLPKTVR
jgi:hypothetical protein